MFSILPSQVWNSLVFLSIMYYKNLQQKNSILNLFLQDVVATQESQLLTAGPERPSSSAHPDEVNDNYIVFLELGTSSSHHLVLSSTPALRLAQPKAASAALRRRRRRGGGGEGGDGKEHDIEERTRFCSGQRWRKAGRRRWRAV